MAVRGRSPEHPRGGTVPVVEQPANRLERPRGSGVPRSHRWSSSARTDTVRAFLGSASGTNAPLPPVACWRRRDSELFRPRPSILSPRERDTCHSPSPALACAAAAARPKCSPSTEYGVSPADGETITRYHPTGSRPPSTSSRETARRRRRSRFRTVAPPTFLPIAKATAGVWPCSRAMNTTVSGPLRARCGDLWKRRNTSRSLIRSTDPFRTIRPRGADGPCVAGP